jgi:Tfp pilus assembly protein PilF
MGVVMGRLSTACLVVMAMTAVGAVAGQQLDPLVASSNDAIVLQQLGVQFIATSQTANALQALRKSLEIDPNSPAAHMWLSVVYSIRR